MLFARSTSLAIGVFLVVGAVAGTVSTRLDTTAWIVDLQWLPGVVARTTAFLLGGFLAWSGIEGFGRPSRVLALVAVGVLGMMACVDAVRFWVLLARGTIASSFPLPASALLAGVCAWIALAAWKGKSMSAGPRQSRLSRHPQLAMLGIGGVLFAVFPIVQMLCFGTTDYRRDADAVLVLGARAFADGSPSDALGDRILTACQLMREGRAKAIILSGGPGDGAFHETDVMRRIALENGVREDQIVIDREGLNSHASVVNAAAIARERGFNQMLAVSHFYHLPRLKLEASRIGLNLYTVPADQRGQVLKKLPYFMARESAAWWWSFAKGMVA